MKPSPQPQESVDPFWRDLRLRLVPDQISLEEADRRMNSIGSEQMNPVEVEQIVRRATSAEATGGPGFPALRAAAAAGLVAVLLSAGVSVSLWPDQRYSMGTKDKAPLSFTAASAMLTDRRESLEVRRISLLRVYTRLKYALIQLGHAARGAGDVAAAAKAARERLQTLLKDVRNAGPAGATTVADYASVCDQVVDIKLSKADRLDAIATVESDFAAGLGCLLEAAVADSQELEDSRDLLVRKLETRANK